MVQMDVTLNPRDYRLTRLGLLQAWKLFQHGSQETRQAVTRTAEATARYAKHKAPQGETGKLKAGISAHTVSNLESVVNSRAKHSVVVDLGAKPHGITPNKRKALMIPVWGAGQKQYTAPPGRRVRGHALYHHKYRKGTKAEKRRLEVDFNFAARVHHPGMKGTGFFSGAAMAARPLLQREVGKAIEKIIRRTRSVGK